MKLRLLNGAHSTSPISAISRATRRSRRRWPIRPSRAFVRGLMDEEVTPTLAVPPGADLGAYKAALIERFAQSGAEAPHLADLHGRQPEAAAAAARHDPRPPDASARRSRGSRSASPPGCATSPASTRRASRSTCATRSRQSSATLADAAGPSAERLAPALLSVKEIFGDDLPASDRFRTLVERSLASLYADGARKTVADLARRD